MISLFVTPPRLLKEPDSFYVDVFGLEMKHFDETFRKSSHMFLKKAYVLAICNNILFKKN